jgi:hypothetical protein
MTPLIRDWVKAYAMSGGDPAEGMWFDISGALHRADVPTLNLTMQESRPPFKHCFVACQGKKENASHEVMMLVMGEDPAEAIVVSARIKIGNRQRQLPKLMYQVRDGQIFAEAYEGEISGDDKQMILRLLALWYGALAQGGEGYQATIKQSFTSRRLQAKGKPPQFDWHTVKIEPAKSKADHQGGTHASPRLHDRRGHLRRLKNGKTCWVKDCKVGDASKGVVFKDYEVRA